MHTDGTRLRERMRDLAVVVLVALTGGAGTVLRPPDAAPPPADAPAGERHLPRRAYAPDPWSQGSDDLGAPGPLAAVAGAERHVRDGLTGTRTVIAWYGVSAVDGSTHFLDLPTLVDASGVVDARRGEVAARRAALLRTAYLLTGHHQVAEDLVQVALVKVVPPWRRIADHPEPYVRAVLARESVSRWRRRRWREVTSDTIPGRDQPGDPPADPADDRLALQQAIRALPPRQRAVVVLRYYEDLTERETAHVLGIAVGTVKSQTRDGLARLRTLLPDLDRGGEPARV
jgi:RNA polymerase sigma-70 factor (sigma-E family)